MIIIILEIAILLLSGIWAMKVQDSEVYRCSDPAVLKNITQEDKTLAVPRLYYKGYQAKTAEHDKLPVYAGDNNQVGVAVPAQYEGIISIEFVEP